MNETILAALIVIGLCAGGGALSFLVGFGVFCIKEHYREEAKEYYKNQ